MDALPSKSVARGDVIVKECELCTELIVVKSGTVKVTSEDGAKRNLQLGDFFGYAALVDEQPTKNAFTAVARTEVELVSIDKKFIESVFKCSVKDLLDRQPIDESDFWKVARAASALPQAKIDFKDLVINKTLGTGTFGRVKVAVDRNTKP